MKRLQITIQEIDNGFIVSKTVVNLGNQPIEQPTAQFCENLEAITIYLNQIWPRPMQDPDVLIDLKK